MREDWTLRHTVERHHHIQAMGTAGHSITRVRGNGGQDTIIKCFCSLLRRGGLDEGGTHEYIIGYLIMISAGLGGHAALLQPFGLTLAPTAETDEAAGRICSCIFIPLEASWEIDGATAVGFGGMGSFKQKKASFGGRVTQWGFDMMTME